MTKRTKVPKRCDAVAYFIAKNGYCACEQHQQYGMMESAVPVGKCDYPVDGLGAARLEKEDD